MNYKYTIQKFNISGKYLNTFHYNTKAEAMKELSHLIELGYQVKFMKYHVWKTACEFCEE